MPEGEALFPFATQPSEWKSSGRREPRLPVQKKAQPPGTPFIPGGGGKHTRLGCIRPGRTSFNPSLFGLAHAPFSSACGLRVWLSGPTVPIRGEFAGCVDLEPVKPSGPPCSTTCRLLGAQPSLRLPGGYLGLSCTNWEKAQLKAVPFFGAPRLGQTLPPETSTCKGSWEES